MLGRIDLKAGVCSRRALTAVKVVFTVSMLAGCSSVPDYVNPVSWFSSEDPVVAQPVGKSGEPLKQSADARKDLAKGLPADKGNSKYAEPVRREVAPTKQLARRTQPAATETQVAQLPEGAVPPKPAVTTQALAARDEGPNAPPASVNMIPPAAADVPETVPVRGRRPLQDQFQRRLAESASQTYSPSLVAMPGSAASGGYGLREEEPIHLVPPSSRRSKGGGKGMAAPAPIPEPSASFQVATLDFDNGTRLSSTDRAAVTEVARLYRQTGGVVRVVGYAPAPVFGGDAVSQVMGGLDSAMKRADAVARELTKRGVPASKIMIGGEPVTAVTEAGAKVYIDVI